MIKNLLFIFFNRTLGGLIRQFQKALIVDKTDTLEKYLQSLAIHESGMYAQEKFTQAMMMQSRILLWDYVSGLVTAKYKIENPAGINGAGGVILEFGVYKGTSINYFAKKAPFLDIYGFDSFEGLQENWAGFSLPKGAFSVKGKTPKVESNVKILKGWFEETLPTFISEKVIMRIYLIHIDCDTYESSKFVLESLGNKLIKGTIILFDEYLAYVGWKNHEFKAWQEVSKSRKLKYKYLAYFEQCVAVEIC